MADKLKLNISKSIFQVRYKPVLCFYDNLYKQTALFEHFPHWQTDRLKVILRDYDKKHSMTIQHDGIAFESDNYKKSEEEQIIKLINDNFSLISSNDNILRLGQRFLCLITSPMDFTELNSILSLKFFSKPFLDVLPHEPTDLSVTIDSKIDGIDFKLLLGPIRKAEIPNFISYNINNHIDPNSIAKYSELSDILNNYPENSLFVDLDLFVDNFKNTKLTIDEFYKKSNLCFESLKSTIMNYFFAEKIK